MKLDRYRICIYPESVLDEAYIEEVLGLKTAGDSIRLVREDVMAFSSVAYLATDANSLRRVKDPEDRTEPTEGIVNQGLTASESAGVAGNDDD